MEDELKVPGQPWKLYLGVGLVGVLAFGLVTWALGLGPFAYRQILYGTSEVYILNMTTETVFVTLDKGKPIEIKPESAERTPILGGTTHLVARDAAGKVIEEVDAFVDGTPVVYNVTGERCMVLSDVSSFYLGAAAPEVKVDKTFPKGTKIIAMPHNRLIWPRETLRDQVQGASEGVAWLELVGCSLIDPSEAHLLDSHLNVLLTERKRAEQERKKAEEIRRLMLQGGGDAVDQAQGRGPNKGATLAVPPQPEPTGAADAGAP